MFACVDQENDTHGQLVNGRFPGDWNNVILPAIPSEQFTQQMSYVIKGLDIAAQYEAKVQAKNRFGWNQESETFLFHTRGAGQYCSLFMLPWYPQSGYFKDDHYYLGLELIVNLFLTHKKENNFIFISLVFTSLQRRLSKQNRPIQSI